MRFFQKMGNGDKGMFWDKELRAVKKLMKVKMSGDSLFKSDIPHRRVLRHIVYIAL